MKRNKKIFLGIIFALVVVTILVLNLGRVIDFTQKLYSGDIQKAEDAATYETTTTTLVGYEVAYPTKRETWEGPVTITLQKGTGSYYYTYKWSKEESEPSDWTLDYINSTNIATSSSFTVSSNSLSGVYYLHIKSYRVHEEDTEAIYTYDGYLGPYYLGDGTTYTTTLEGFEIAYPTRSETWKKSVDVTLQKAAGDTYKYGWKWKLGTDEPDSILSGTNTSDNPITITSSSLSGKYHLHIYTAKDISSNSYDYWGYLGPYYLDNTEPTPATMTMKLGDSSGENYTDGTWTNQDVYLAIDTSNAGDPQSGKANLTHKYKVDKQNDDGSTTNLDYRTK